MLCFGWRDPKKPSSADDNDDHDDDGMAELGGGESGDAGGADNERDGDFGPEPGEKKRKRKATKTYLEKKEKRRVKYLMKKAGTPINLPTYMRYAYSRHLSSLIVL